MSAMETVIFWVVSVFVVTYIPWVIQRNYDAIRRVQEDLDKLYR